MKRWAVVLALIPSLLRADITQRLNVRTQDGTVNTYPYSAKFTNGTLTDNGDGTVSIAITGGGGTWGSITGTLSSQTDLWTQFTAVYTSTNAIVTRANAVATSTTTVAVDTTTINTRANLVAGATAQVAIDTTTLNSRANLAAAATAQVAIDTTTLNTRANLVAAATAQVAIDTTAVNGRIEPIYPSTGMPTFPFGIVTSSINASSNTVIAGSTFYQNGPILLGSNVTISGSAGFSSTSLYGIVGSVSANNAAAGNVGEYVESVVASVNFPATGTYGDATSISLTAGDWDVSFAALGVAQGALISTYASGISTTSGNSTTGLVFGSNYLVNISGFATSTSSNLSVSVYRVSISATTTVYAKFEAGYTGGPPQMFGRLSARRMR